MMDQYLIMENRTSIIVGSIHLCKGALALVGTIRSMDNNNTTITLLCYGTLYYDYIMLLNITILATIRIPAKGMLFIIFVTFDITEVQY